MEPTRRLWSVATLAGGGAVLAVVLAEPLVLGVPLGVGVWVMAHQLTLTKAIERATSDPTAVTQSVAEASRLVNEPTTLSIDIAEGFVQTDFHPEVSVKLPPALVTDSTTTYAVSEDGGSISIQVRAPVSGSFEIPRPTLEVTSPNGLFRASVPVGNEVSLGVEPRVPRDLRVGTGGQRIGMTRGSHDADLGTPGFEPWNLREYVPGDPANLIDWKATARFSDLYVQEFATRTTRRTHLFVDCRAAMFTGDPGQTKLDYAREIGLWLVGYAADNDDPIGVSIVDDTLVSGATDFSGATRQYRTVRRHLRDLTTEHSDRGTSGDDTQRTARRSTRTAREAHRIAVALGGDNPYAETLAPYFGHIESYVDRASGRPLFEAVHARLDEASAEGWLVIVSDDTHRDELLATARAAADRHARVSLFLLPSALFDPNPVAAREAYVDFESFRRRLSAIESVTAFEAGPGERLGSLFASSRTEGVRE